MTRLIRSLLSTPESRLKPRWSLEFFPPKEPSGASKLYQVLAAFKASCDPLFCSVTWGAGGSTLRGSLDIVEHIQNNLQITALAHLTGLGMTPTETRSILSALRRRGIRNILALRGDKAFDSLAAQPLLTEMGENPIPQKPAGINAAPFRFASDLIQFIHSEEGLGGDPFSISAAACPEGHPDAKDLPTYLDHLAAKIHLGLDALITQFFLSNDFYYRFLEQLSKRESLQNLPPFIPGIMILTKASAIHRMVELSHCAVPKQVQEALEKYRDDDASMAKWGINFATQQIMDLHKRGSNFFHFYTLNKFEPTYEVIQNLQALFNPTRTTPQDDQPVLIPFRSYYATPDERELAVILRSAGLDPTKPHDIVFNQTLKRFEVTQKPEDRLI